jgi:hypothetical protein
MHRPFRSLPLAVWAGRVHLVRAWRSAAGDRPLRTRSMMERQGLVTADSPIALDHSLHTLDHEDPKPMEAHDSSAKKGRILSPRLDKEGRQAGTHRQHEAYGKTRPLLLHMPLRACLPVPGDAAETPGETDSGGYRDRAGSVVVNLLGSAMIWDGNYCAANEPAARPQAVVAVTPRRRSSRSAPSSTRLDRTTCFTLPRG